MFNNFDKTYKYFDKWWFIVSIIKKPKEDFRLKTRPWIDKGWKDMKKG